jgi:hypothetical protein
MAREMIRGDGLWVRVILVEADPVAEIGPELTQNEAHPL